MKHSLIIFFLMFSLPALSCICGGNEDLALLQRSEYERSDLIFIGEVINSDSDEDTYQLQIIEILKGTFRKKIVSGKIVDSCSLFPKESDGMWIVYANYNDDGSINISDCGLSRHVNFSYAPAAEADLPVLPDPSKDKTMDILDEHILMFDSRVKALKVLRAEIEQLRKWK